MIKNAYSKSGGGIKSKGFTLIELLAVIVILAVIALIATPIILNIIEKARKSAFLDSVYGIEESANFVYMEQVLSGIEIQEKTFVFDGGKPEGLNYSGSNPKGGSVVVRTDGTILLALHNGTWCATKGQGDRKVTLTKYDGNCVIPENAKDPVIALKGEANITLQVGETYTESGAEAKTVDGSSLTYTTEIKKGEEIVTSIDTSKEGTYTITYKAESNGKTSTVTRIVTIETKNADETGANEPNLSNGLVPVKWNGTVWIKADSNNPDGANQWYDYSKQMWANAVSVTSSYRNVAVGTEIPESEIYAYFVWIPRYEYDYKDLETKTSASEIKINFVKGTSKTATTNYMVHPAFTFGTEELTGIWVGKFETTGTATTPTIKPNVPSLAHQIISAQFATAQKFSASGNSYGISSSADGHMMKNSEWGAVAYLSQSKYGKYGNANYTGANKEVYINNYWNYNNNQTMTGCSSGSTSASNSATCAYTYEKESTGTGASTTGTIYGVYDMSGGAFEYVMGVYRGSDAASTWGASTESNYAGFSSAPASKYYDEYTSRTSNDACNNGVCYGHALSETGGWYSDKAYFADAFAPWFFRGGLNSDTTDAGLFASVGSKGTSGPVNSSYSFRVVLVQ